MRSGIKLLVRVQTTCLDNRIREGLFGDVINCHCWHIFGGFFQRSWENMVFMRNLEVLFLLVVN